MRDENTVICQLCKQAIARNEIQKHYCEAWCKKRADSTDNKIDYEA